MIRFRGFIQSVLRGRSSFLFIISVASFIATCQFIVSYNAMKSNHKGSDSDNHGFSLAFLQSLVNFSTTSIPSDVVRKSSRLAFDLEELLINLFVYYVLFISDELSKPKYILYWNEAYGSTKYGFCCGQEPFVKYDCPVNNCFATDNRSFFGSEADVSSFDAIVFHQRSLNQEDLPRSRLRDQRYVMFMLESAHYPFGFAGYVIVYQLSNLIDHHPHHPCVRAVPVQFKGNGQSKLLLIIINTIILFPRVGG